MSRSREQWKQGLSAELAYWEKWFASAKSGNAEALEDYQWRTEPSADMRQRDYLIPYLKLHAPPGATVSILDVGAGPMTFFPRQWITRTLNITAIDPLADDYMPRLTRAGISPPVKTITGEAEKLTSQFAGESFDLVFARNAFEQTYDPRLALREMLTVLKKNHSIVLLQEGERDEAQSQRGPWIMSEEDDEVLVGTGTDRFNLRDELGEQADVKVSRSWHWPWFLSAITKR